ncbi:tRNA lysidine(34) synthetase TilS [Deltaproteobacteria bacterium OttesenSCG-928-K17]|nr:tRNA lysidine(34) synthetase TilS [Deltaproteobacteria bacterium OttesenSCG-928-K17]
MPDLGARFEKTLDGLRPGWRAERLIVAYSGGLDSAVLLHLAAKSFPPGQVAAAHLNHSLRPEADSEQAFAERQAQSLGVFFITGKSDVTALAGARRRGLEEAARQARYEFLKQAAIRWPAAIIATAHQADDQLETMLMCLVKGGGAGGLAGIHPRRPLAEGEAETPEIIRPLLSVSRDELKVWALKHNLRWVEDSSNLDDHYLRNSLRINVIPLLKQLNPQLSQAAARTAAILRTEEDFWDARLKTMWRNAVVQAEADGLVLDRAALAGLTRAERRRLVYEAMLKVQKFRAETPEPLSFDGVETALDLLDLPKHKGLDLPGGVRVELTAQSFVVTLASRLRRAK